ncbi:hypothetical protein M655_024935 [Brevibacillus sp. NSP2.1]|uniref:HNH endonuclease n=1 Tax=Brevibacillus sp. NSP2.1 TaxID=3003229 RepID=UPI001396D3F8|nr:HNH endonuclease [Brevibacillus sp. NSP2.1]QHZ58617.1 hypothetical protein M655_024935 [Brevibacillus sp. NSP2.1]
MIDIEDFDKANEVNASWYGKWSGNLYVWASVRENGKRRSFSLHRYLFDFPNGMVIDHINGNPLDNRRNNLRVVSHQENIQNRWGANADNESTGILGVYFRKDTGKYRAIIGFNNKIIHLGTYETIEEAIAARRQAEKLLFKCSPLNSEKERCS